MEWITSTLLVVDFIVKVVAVGLVPENRRPSSSMAWLMLILVIPLVGLPLFLLIGSPYVQGRRHRIQNAATEAVTDATADLPALPPRLAPSPELATIVQLNRELTAFPLSTGVSHGLHYDYDETIAAMATAVDTAQQQVNVEIYIMAWDDTTDVFFTALARAVDRGVTVRLLLDHLGSRGYPGWRRTKQKMTASGIDWHVMMPLLPLQGRWRRPDLRNHRKLLIVDERRAFMGSMNMIDSSYLKPKNLKAGRHWRDCNIELSGPIVEQLSAVFGVDWYTETGEVLQHRPQPPIDHDEDSAAMQLIPSGPGYTTAPTLRLFTSLVHSARERISIVSPYFIPDESLMLAITSAAYRGVEVELFVSEQADQFMVHHAQRSYYEELLRAGVRIWAYPKPFVLHSKYMTVDDHAAVFGSSNMDMRSFYLDYEITLFGIDPAFVADLDVLSAAYRDISPEITLEQWNTRRVPVRYLDNVLRMTSSLQ